MGILRLLMIATFAAALAGCETAPVKTIQEGVKGLFQRNEGEPKLSAGIRNYEDGQYNEAAKNLQASLDLGLSDADQVKAHKYLAFINCVSGRESQCRGEFRKALAIDPSFELDPAEAGHPIWGPVFRGVKGQR